MPTASDTLKGDPPFGPHTRAMRTSPSDGTIAVTFDNQLLLDHLHPLARHSMSETVDNAMAREVASLVVALSK